MHYRTETTLAGPAPLSWEALVRPQPTRARRPLIGALPVWQRIVVVAIFVAVVVVTGGHIDGYAGFAVLVGIGVMKAIEVGVRRLWRKRRSPPAD